MLFGDRMIKGIVSFKSLHFALLSTGIQGETCRRQRHQFLHRQWPFFQCSRSFCSYCRYFLLLSSPSCMTEYNCCISHPLSAGYSRLFWEMLEVTKWSEDGRLRRVQHNGSCTNNTFHAPNVSIELEYLRAPQKSILWTSWTTNLPSKFHSDVFSTPHKNFICGTVTKNFFLSHNLKWEILHVVHHFIIFFFRYCKYFGTVKLYPYLNIYCNLRKKFNILGNTLICFFTES